MEHDPNAENSMNRISFNYYAGKIRVYEKVVEVLGYPRFLQFLINPETRNLYLRGTDKRDINCLEVPDREFRKRNQCTLHGKSFIKRICTLSGWKLNKLHVLRGSYLPEYNMIVFPLADALELDSSSE